MYRVLTTTGSLCIRIKSRVGYIHTWLRVPLEEAVGSFYGLGKNKKLENFLFVVRNYECLHLKVFKEKSEHT